MLFFVHLPVTIWLPMFKEWLSDKEKVKLDRAIQFEKETSKKFINTLKLHARFVLLRLVYEDQYHFSFFTYGELRDFMEEGRWNISDFSKRKKRHLKYLFAFLNDFSSIHLIHVTSEFYNMCESYLTSLLLECYELKTMN